MKVTFPERGAEVIAEVARTPEELRNGLMGRTSLRDGEGMLFVMPTRDRHGFWMANTRIPLDLIFIDGDRVVGGLSLQPEDRRVSRAGAPSTHVLEVPGGWIARRGVQVGDLVRLGDLG